MSKFSGDKVKDIKETLMGMRGLKIAHDTYMRLTFVHMHFDALGRYHKYFRDCVTAKDSTRRDAEKSKIIRDVEKNIQGYHYSKEELYGAFYRTCNFMMECNDCAEAIIEDAVKEAVANGGKNLKKEIERHVADAFKQKIICKKSCSSVFRTEVEWETQVGKWDGEILALMDGTNVDDINAVSKAMAILLVRGCEALCGKYQHIYDDELDTLKIALDFFKSI